MFQHKYINSIYPLDLPSTDPNLDRFIFFVFLGPITISGNFSSLRTRKVHHGQYVGA